MKSIMAILFSDLIRIRIVNVVQGYERSTFCLLVKSAEYNKQPIFYKRFIDDGFGLWTHGSDELMKCIDYANKIHENIKVELRWNTTQIDFLNTKILLENDKITTDLYSKPTDKHQYVQYASDHPTNVKKAIPYGLGIRLRRICSDENKY